MAINIFIIITILCTCYCHFPFYNFTKWIGNLDNYILSTEGGRLEAELKYTAKALGEADSSTHQLIIQTAKDPDASLLHAGALLDHLKVHVVDSHFYINVTHSLSYLFNFAKH